MEHGAESNGATTMLPPPGIVALLRHTPLRDLVRGRVTGRLDWRRAIAAAGLPTPIVEFVTRVVRRTRLWRGERVEVADELVAHFRDGLAAGASAEAIVGAFGDERRAAKLIRRAKRRNRPLAWHALKWTRRGTGALILLYAILFIRFRSGRPTIAVDYVAVLNQPVLATPVTDRAWPIYRQAVPALGLGYTFDAAAGQYVRIEPYLDESRADAHGGTLFEALPTDAAWPTLTKWLDEHQHGLELVRAAARKPAFGFVPGPGGDAYDPTITGHATPSPAAHRSILDDSTISVLLPHLNIARKLCLMIAADLRYARWRHDGARLDADLDAMLGIAGQLNGPTVIEQLVAMSCHRIAFDAAAQTITDSPELLDDATLIHFAHLIGTRGGDTAAGFLDYSGEVFFDRDILQRLYTDDGNGDGRLTGDALENLTSLTALSDRSMRWQRRIATAMAATGLTPFKTRRAVQDELDRCLSLGQAHLARPMYQQPGLAQDPDADLAARLRQIDDSTLESARLLPATILLPAFGRAQLHAERLIGRRDGVVIGLALELYRRRNDGQYPPTLDALVPQLLPHVPADRITGQPVHYRLIEGHPVVYSVGVDRDDDAGRPALKAGDRVATDDDAASIGNDPKGTPPVDGDWVLYDGRSGRNAKSTTAPASTHPD